MMAKENDPWKKFRDRDDEREEDEGPSLRDKRTASTGAPQKDGQPADGGKLEDQMHSSDVLIDQLNQLYQMYFLGVEKRPPIEKRALLDASITRIQAAPKLQQGISFKWNTLLAKYNVHKERWDRLLKDLEKGKRGAR